MYLLGLALSFIIFIHANGHRTALLTSILAIASLVILLYLVHLFQPSNTDKLGVALWYIAGMVILSLFHSAVVFLLFLQTFRFT